MRRLLRVELSGFRAFTSGVDYDLDADVVVLKGANGTGKTSLFDAVLWALTGHVYRLEGRGGNVLSLYSRSGQARVALDFLDREGKVCRVIRTSDGEVMDILLETRGRQLQGSMAEAHLLELMWPEVLSSRDGVEMLHTVFTRSVYLQQDLVREFLDSDSEEARFEVVSELVGAGRLGQFQRQLDSARTAWTRARTQLERSALQARDVVDSLKSRLNRLSEDAEPEARVEGEWTDWWSELVSLGLASDVPAVSSAASSQHLGRLLQVLQVERRSAERNSTWAESLQVEIRESTPRPREPSATLERYRAGVADLREQLSKLRRGLVEAQSAAAEDRMRQVEAREEAEELHTLATLALRHIGGVCPVCGQGHNVEATRRRLEQLQESAVSVGESSAAQLAVKLAEEVSRLESDLANAEARLSTEESKMRESTRREQELVKELRELGISTDVKDAAPSLTKLRDEATKHAELMGSLYSRGERLALAVARASEAAQRMDVAVQLADAETELRQLESQLADHNRTREVAQRLLEETRRVSEEAVEQRIKAIEPVVRRIYSRIDPHPGFTLVRLLTGFFRGRGQISALVSDPAADLTNQDPFPVFSNSQLNSLAVSLFLGFNLGAPTLPLETAMLDDPLQSLDDVNLLGLVDTLRRTKALRQLFISTHDPRFASLLERKLRPVGESEKTLVLEFEGWIPSEGPVVSMNTVPRDRESFRVAAA